MTRVLYCITELDVGGAESMLTELALGLKARGWQPAVACLAGSGPLAEKLRQGDVAVHMLHAVDYWSAPAVTFRLCRLMRSLRPGILHSFLFHANILGRISARLSGVPHVISSMRVAERRYYHHLVIEGLTCNLSDRVVCVSQDVANYARRYARIPSDRLAVIPNGVRMPDRRERGKLEPELEQFIGARTVTLCVARQEYQKGIDVLIKAMHHLVRQVPGVCLLIVGEGPERQRYGELVQKLGVGSYVKFLGKRSDMEHMFSLADMFVLPSRWEGMSNALLEAMAHALPVVVTDVEGTRELVQNGRSGILVEVGNPMALAQAVSMLASNPAKRQAMGTAARSIAKQYSIDAMIDRHIELYRCVLG